MPSLTCRLLAIALPLAVLCGTQANAQSNVLSIVQDGGANTLKVDQSRASGSQVGGLSIDTPRFETFTLAPATTNAQGKTRPATTVSLLVLGADAARDQPAQQTGTGNAADITISRDRMKPELGGFVGLRQDSTLTGLGNRATVNLTGTGQALIGQLGGNNRATATIGAGALEGTIVQGGVGNVATLNVTGPSAIGSISQFGVGLNNGLNVTGAGTNAALIANGVSNAVPGAAVTVESNGAAVTITQSPM